MAVRCPFCAHKEKTHRLLCPKCNLVSETDEDLGNMGVGLFIFYFIAVVISLVLLMIVDALAGLSEEAVLKTGGVLAFLLALAFAFVAWANLFQPPITNCKSCSTELKKPIYVCRYCFNKFTYSDLVNRLLMAFLGAGIMVAGTHYITDVYGNEKPLYLVVAFLVTMLVLIHGISIYFKAVKKAEQELEGQPSLYVPPDPRPSLALAGQSPALERGTNQSQGQAYQYESQIEPPERY